MAKNDIDLENLSEDDIAYIEAREWMIAEIELQGMDWQQLKAESGFDSGSGEDNEGQDDEVDYESMTVAQLDAEIAERNEGRAEDDLIADDGKKADKIAALEADDEARSE